VALSGISIGEDFANSPVFPVQSAAVVFPVPSGGKLNCSQ